LHAAANGADNSKTGGGRFVQVLERLGLPEDIVRVSADTMHYGMGKAAEAVAAIVLIPVLTRVFTPAEFGLWEVAITFFMLTATMVSLALEPAIAAFYFETQDAARRRAVASTAVYFRLVSSVVVAVAVFVLAPQISRIIFDTADHASLFRIVAVIIPFFLATNIFKQLLRVDFSPLKFNAVAVGYAGLYTVLASILVVRMGIVGVFWAILAASVCCACIGWVLSRRLFSLVYSWRVLREMLDFCLPLIPVLLACWVLDFSDRYFLTKMSTLEQVGIYSVGARISSIIILCVASFQMAWAPYALSIQHRPDAREQYSQGLWCFLVAALTGGTAIVVFSRPILIVLAERRYFGAEQVVAFLVFAAVAYGAANILNMGLILTKRTVMTGGVFVVGAVLNLVLNYLLIPGFGMMGAAVATLISYLVAAALLYVFAQKYYRIDYRLKRIALLALLAVGTMIVSSLVGIQRSLVADIIFDVALMICYLVLLWKFFLSGLTRAQED
jgi:O-antigen/teichoic acid export membrane protein